MQQHALLARDVPRIALIGAEPRLAALLGGFLAGRGLEVTHARGLDGVATDGDAPDLVALDLGTPEAGGLDGCRRLRERFGGAIMVLAPSSAQDDHVAALELGADDFVVKPIDPRVLVARMRSLVRRLHRAGTAAAPTPMRIALDRLVIDRELRVAHVGERRVELTGSEFSILWILAVNRGHAVTREALHTAALGTRWSPLDRGLDAHVSRIRRKLQAAGLAGAPIQSVRGEGYRLVGA